jgi:hypothetical protein
MTHSEHESPKEKIKPEPEVVYSTNNILGVPMLTVFEANTNCAKPYISPETETDFALTDLYSGESYQRLSFPYSLKRPALENSGFKVHEYNGVAKAEINGWSLVVTPELDGYAHMYLRTAGSLFLNISTNCPPEGPLYYGTIGESGFRLNTAFGLPKRYFCYSINPEMKVAYGPVLAGTYYSENVNMPAAGDTPKSSSTKYEFVTEAETKISEKPSEFYKASFTFGDGQKAQLKLTSGDNYCWFFYDTDGNIEKMYTNFDGNGFVDIKRGDDRYEVKIAGVKRFLNKNFPEFSEEGVNCDITSARIDWKRSLKNIANEANAFTFDKDTVIHIKEDFERLILNRIYNPEFLELFLKLNPTLGEFIREKNFNQVIPMLKSTLSRDEAQYVQYVWDRYNCIIGKKKETSLPQLLRFQP